MTLRWKPITSDAICLTKHLEFTKVIFVTRFSFLFTGCPFNEVSDSPKAERNTRSTQKETGGPTFTYHGTPFWSYQYVNNPRTGGIHAIQGFASPHQISYPLWTRATPAYVLAPFHYYPFQFGGWPQKQTKQQENDSDNETSGRPSHNNIFSMSRFSSKSHKLFS